MVLVTTGTTPQRAHTWKSAVRVPCAYFETSEASLTVTSSDPRGVEVHTPPCLAQKEQVQARAWISVGLGSHTSANAMLPQWHWPRISMRSGFLALVRPHDPPAQ